MPALKTKKLINLLPEEYAPSSKFTASMLFFARINKILTVLAIIVLTAIGGIFVYENNLLRHEVGQNQLLKQEIVLHEDSEQKLVLVKDRLEKAGRILNREMEVDMGRAEQLIGSLPLDVGITGVLFSEGVLKINLITPNSDILAKTLGATLTKEIFKIVNLTSFSFKPDQGYAATLELK